MEKPLRIAG